MTSASVKHPNQQNGHRPSLAGCHAHITHTLWRDLPLQAQAIIQDEASLEHVVKLRPFGRDRRRMMAGQVDCARRELDLRGDPDRCRHED
jgi:hypothetical protein